MEENPFLEQTSFEPNIEIPNTTFKKKATSLSDLKQKIQQPLQIENEIKEINYLNQNQNQSSEIKNSSRYTSIQSLAQKKQNQNQNNLNMNLNNNDLIEVKTEMSNEPNFINPENYKNSENIEKTFLDNNLPFENENLNIKTNNSNIYQGNQLNQINQINQEYQENFENFEKQNNIDYIEVPENHYLLKFFPMIFPPNNNFPIFTFWIIILFLLTFYGRSTFIRKCMIFVLGTILYIILQNWDIYLALWNEGIYSDSWLDKWIHPKYLWISSAQSTKEVKGILFFIYLIILLGLQIFLYFYQP